MLLLILLIGIAVRVVGFGSLPPGLNQDEASTGYDAFALLRYGIDRNGFHSPVMLVSWGSGMYALAAYMTMPFFALFGVSVTTLRLPHLCLGILSLLLFFLLVRRTGDRVLALLAVFLLAVSPWHTMVSRWALDSNLFPPLILIGVLLLSYGCDRWPFLPLATAFFALSLYAYGTAYAFVPLFLMFVGTYLFFQKRLGIQSMLWSVIPFVVIALPIVGYIAINHFQWSSFITPFLSIPRLPSIPRFSSVSIFSSAQPLFAMAENMRTLWQLLITGNDGLIWNAIPGFPYLTVIGLPFAILGIILFAFSNQSRRSTVHVFFFFWLISALLLATLEPVNINRINIIFLPLTFFCAVGVRSLVRRRIPFVLTLLFFALSFIGFLGNYFGTYRSEAGPSFFSSLEQAIDSAADQTRGPICITGSINQPYIFVLFFRQIDPRIFLASVQYDNPGAEFQTVSSFDRYRFGLERCDASLTEAYITTRDEESQIDSKTFRIERFENYSVGLRR